MLDQKYSAVLQLVNTNEAQQERSLAKKKEAGEEDLEDHPGHQARREAGCQEKDAGCKSQTHLRQGYGG